jgi:radical SAM superfamily enzyme YgiQ (UPF0313 family)
MDKPTRYVWVNAGVETASPRLLDKISAGKIRPYHCSEWSDIVIQTVGKMNDTDYFPFLSIILGIPTETDEDIIKTIELIDDLKNYRTAVFPIFWVGIHKSEQSFTIENMTTYHWELLKKSYEMNFKWLPRLFWDNQRRANVSFFKRIITQFLGKVHILKMRKMLRGV